MHRLLDCIDKELECIEYEGINTRNLDILYKLIDIKKDIYKIKKYDKELNEHLEDEEECEEFEHYIQKIHKGLKKYIHGKEKYHDEKLEDDMINGLEYLMSSIAEVVMTTSKMASTQHEKEVISRNIQKMVNAQ